MVMSRFLLILWLCHIPPFPPSRHILLEIFSYCFLAKLLLDPETHGHGFLEDVFKYCYLGLRNIYGWYPDVASIVLVHQGLNAKYLKRMITAFGSS